MVPKSTGNALPVFSAMTGEAKTANCFKDLGISNLGLRLKQLNTIKLGVLLEIGS